MKRHFLRIVCFATLFVLAPALRAQTIPNPSFEQNIFSNPANASVASNGPITGWTPSDTANVGLNPSGGVSNEADNGAVPNVKQVAWIRSAGSVTTTFSTTIGGLVVGRHYRVQFRANQRTGTAPSPSISLNGGARVRFTASPAVGGTNPYRTLRAIFVATATTAVLEISNTTASASTLLVDHFTISAATNVTVTNANDAGAGSLRAVLAAAAGTAAFNVITFAPALNGATITLASDLVVNDAGGVAIDVSSLLNGLTLHGGSGNNRIFDIGNDAIVSLRRLTLTSGGVSGTASGGAIENAGVLSLLQCTLTQNRAGQSGGAISSGGHLELTRCTLQGNAATANDSSGGAIQNRGTLFLNHCTISENSADGTGNAITNHRAMTIINSIISGNDGDGSEEIENAGGGASILLVGVNFMKDPVSSGGATVTGEPEGDDPKLESLGANGGPTQTMAISSGSPARNAGGSTMSFTDQRGLPIIGQPDIGAFEVQAGTFFFIDTRVAEGQDARISILRLIAASGPVTLRLTMTPGSAISPADFDGRAQTVEFADGETVKTVVVPTVGDFVVEGNQTFFVALSFPSATPGATLFNPTASVTIVDPIQVTNVNDDGPGSLRQAFRTAGANSGADTIHFSAALNGKTITLGGRILVVDGSGVTVDAGNLPQGLTIDGGPGRNRLVTIGSPCTLELKHLTLTGGHPDFNDSGGAIQCLPDTELRLTRCTLVGNRAEVAGGALTNSGTMTLTQCTLSGNTATQGGAISNSGTLHLIHCTVSENTANEGGGIANNVRCVLEQTIVSGNSAPTGGDLRNTDLVQCVGLNFVSALSNAGSPIDTSDGSINGSNPQLGPLANHGGPTKTYSLLAHSPAVDAAGSSSIVSDQRRFPIVEGTPDVGAFEAQAGGTFSLDQIGYSIAENASFIKIRVLRTGSFLGEATVRLTTTPGTASAADFDGKPNTAASDVTFQANEFDKTITIDINGDSVPEPNETFTVTLSRPSPGCSIGAPASAIVVIRDTLSTVPANDGSFPTTTVTFPAAGAVLNVPVGGAITVTGTAFDNKGVNLVAVFQEGPGAVGQAAALLAPGAAITGWRRDIIPQGGINRIEVLVGDVQGNTNPVRAIRTFKVQRPLEVNISGVGSVTPGFSPSSFREVGRPYTVAATAGAGAMFAGWSILSGHTPEDLGISISALERGTLTFVNRQGLALRATFVPNPFDALSTGKFNGAIAPSSTAPAGGTDRGISTEGYISMKVQATGAFSGSLKIDGMTLNVAGAFDHLGIARFGTSRATTLHVTRPGKPSLAVSLRMDVTFNGGLTGNIVQTEAATAQITAVSNVGARQASFSAANPVPPTSFNATAERPATGVYTTIFSNPGNAIGSTRAPQGSGRGTVTLRTDGVLIVACTLADGTPLTMSTTVAQNGTWRLFSQLYPGLQGYVVGDFDINHSTSEDFFALNSGFWVRPVLDRQHFPTGWQDGLIVNIIGVRYVPEPNVSVMAVTQPTGTGDGNATLSLSDLSPPPEFVRSVDISSSDVVTEVPPDATYSLIINRSTGFFSGTFRHPDGTLVPYSGVVLQKGRGGLGFYLTTTPAVKDYTGQGGSVRLAPQP